jgi:DNA segregation ATPase FtsK/SpoIIIE, S-DNA-T family
MVLLDYWNSVKYIFIKAMKKKTSPATSLCYTKESKALLLLTFALVSLICLFSFDINDKETNWLGIIGHFYSWILTYLFGLTIYPFLGFLSYFGWKMLVKKEPIYLKSKFLYLTLLTISCAMLLNLLAEKKIPIPKSLHHKIFTETINLKTPFTTKTTRQNLGGVPCYYLYRDVPLFNIQQLLNNVGVGITFSLMALLSLYFLTDYEILDLVQKIFKQSEKKQGLLSQEQLEKKLSPQPFPPPFIEENPATEKTQEIPIKTMHERERKKTPLFSTPYDTNSNGYTIPSHALLTKAKNTEHPQLKQELRRKAEILEKTLLSFGIEAKVGDINCGPTIASFEIHPAVGVKVQKITALENDIALNLQAKSIRIVAPIPGKAVVGVEIPSPYPQEVSFKEMLLTYQQTNRKLHIPIILGKTVSGENVIADLAKMPHCLIAGATGSGKSVCINTLIMSILMNATPEEIKLIMIDPKKVELTPYSSLPHLIAPVITEPHGAYAALNWLVQEMQKRYEILKHLGLRNISAFNTRKINPELEASLTITVPEKMTAIVGIIDEFADLMMASSSDLETPIARIAQMARAVGIHLVLATQRPSREVITGLIKANFPTRIAFKVASRINSQIILDENGAESLLGNGDMLFLPPGTSSLIRAQGAFISDEDINKIIDHICREAPPNYLIPSFDSMGTNPLENSDENPKDTLYEQAKAIVIATQSTSTTYLQRKFKIGYARAASLIDELESRGIISPQEGGKRRVLIENHERTD